MCTCGLAREAAIATHYHVSGNSRFNSQHTILQTCMAHKHLTWMFDVMLQGGDPKAALGAFEECKAAGHECSLKVYCQLIIALSKCDRPHGRQAASGSAYGLWQALVLGRCTILMLLHTVQVLS